jgi:prephenate dehydratase
MEKKIKKSIAIQGGQGSFHEIAAIFQFGNQNIKTYCFNTFGELVRTVEKDEVDFGLIAIENTVAGSLIPNYALLESSEIEVVGEILLRIEQNLLALPGQKLEDIREVYSHPIALMQCSQFLNEYPNMRLIESEDTALSGAKIQKENLKGAAAIASQRAAELYGLSVLKAGIETNKRNFTRFLIIRSKSIKNQPLEGKPDKSSISFTLPHSTGSLAKVLSVFMFYNINLTKIQSIPIIGKEWEYHFLVDLTYDDFELYKQALLAVQPLTAQLQILGEYKKADDFFQSNEVVVDTEIETVEMI